MLVIRVGASNDYAAFAQTPAGVLRWIVTGWELDGWAADNETVELDPAGFAATVNAGRTLGSINADVTRITGVTADQWAARLIA